MAVFSKSNIITNNSGIDTIKQVTNYQTLLKILAKNGLKIQSEVKGLPINAYIKSIENALKFDKKKRYKKDAFKIVIEFVKFGDGVGLSNYIIIIRNIPFLFDYALAHKKAKGAFCLVIYAGLHQPTKHIDAKAMSFISLMLKRKSFKVVDMDIATDFKSTKATSYRAKDEFKKALTGLENNSYIAKSTSLYSNDLKSPYATKTLMYDKFIKQSQAHKQHLSDELSSWKRVETTIKPTKPLSFIDYIKSDDFKQGLSVVDEINRRLGVSDTKSDFLAYQLNSILDNRALNNNESKKRFNSLKSLNRFVSVGFKPYDIGVNLAKFELKPRLKTA